MGTCITSDFVFSARDERPALDSAQLAQLRRLLPEQPDEPHQLLAVLDGLRVSLANQFDREEQDGYLEEVLLQFPNWSPQVERLRQQHQILLAQLRALRDRVERDRPFPENLQAARRHLERWTIRLAAHEQHETRLLQAAFNLDIGALD
jgi:hypothetical protein